VGPTTLALPNVLRMSGAQTLRDECSSRRPLDALVRPQRDGLGRFPPVCSSHSPVFASMTTAMRPMAE